MEIYLYSKNLLKKEKWHNILIAKIKTQGKAISNCFLGNFLIIIFAAFWLEIIPGILKSFLSVRRVLTKAGLINCTLV